VPGERCPARHIPARPLEELVWRDLCAVLQDPAMITHAMERARGGHWLPQELQARRANLRRGRAGLAQQLARLTKAYLAGAVPLGEYQRRRRENELRRLALERQEQQLTADAERQDTLAKLAAHTEAFCRRVQEGLAGADFARKRALIELLIDRVIVADGAVEIRYVLPTGPEGEREPFCRLRTDYLHRLPGRKVSRQHPPGHTAAQDVEDGVEDLAQNNGASTSSAFRLRKQRLEDRILFVGQITVIALVTHPPHIYRVYAQTSSKAAVRVAPCSTTPRDHGPAAAPARGLLPAGCILPDARIAACTQEMRWVNVVRRMNHEPARTQVGCRTWTRFCSSYSRASCCSSLPRRRGITASVRLSGGLRQGPPEQQARSKEEAGRLTASPARRRSGKIREAKDGRHPAAAAIRRL
jgi:hypothetical protein